MNKDFTLNLRAFTVQVQRSDSSDCEHKTVVLEKSQLQAAQLLGMSSDNLVKRYFKEQGYTVVKVIRCEKKAVSLDLEKLFYQGSELT